ncbi:MAG: N-6 DNA methylase, partial [Clostridia bacterium]|nr:N-6 DNA methylase [Clostridia bacterium]
MCNIATSRLAESVEKLRDRYDVTVISLINNEWKTESYSKNPLERSEQEIYAQYYPHIRDFVLADVSYQNSCKNADRDNALLEGESAIRRAASEIQDTGFMRMYYDAPDFHDRMHREVLEETYPVLTQNAQEQRIDAMLAFAEQAAKESAYADTKSELTDEQKTIVEAFETAGMRFSPTAEGEVRFEDKNGHPMAYTSWNDAYGTIDGAEFPETPGLRDEIQQILHLNGIPGWTEETIPYSVGDTVYLEDGTPFIIEYIGKHDIQLRDPSLDYPIYRAESHGSFQKLMEQFPQPEKEAHPRPEQTEYTTKTVAVYPAEENRMPFDVVIQTIGTKEPVEIPPENYRITDDDLGAGGAKAKFRMNMDAINTLKRIESENRHATPEEQEILSKYVGWGGLADVFDDSKENWQKEYVELSAVLTPEEYTAARSSTLNAHYTSPTVIKAIYEAVGNMGFQTGNILEPAMGVGNFFGLLPEEMTGSKLYGVELDSITGRIAKQLYPNADITVAGFETTDRRDFFDLAVGNVPFGNYKVNDRAYNKLGFSIHDYFFAKTLDQVRPGGVIAFVTSRYTMDKQSPEVRKYIAERADLLGAIRLPNNAFKKNAGTEVTTDILFLQKRDRPQVIEPDWVHLGQTPDGITVNSYFVEHPEMVLGTLKLDDMMYGSAKEV